MASYEGSQKAPNTVLTHTCARMTAKMLYLAFYVQCVSLGDTHVELTDRLPLLVDSKRVQSEFSAFPTEAWRE